VSSCREVYAAVERCGEAKWRTLLDSLLCLLRLLVADAEGPAHRLDGTLACKHPAGSEHELHQATKAQAADLARKRTSRQQDAVEEDDWYKLVRTIAVLVSCWRLGEGTQIVTIGREDNVRVLMGLLQSLCVRWRENGGEEQCAAALAVIDILRKSRISTWPCAV
jgi:hypothetical protein